MKPTDHLQQLAVVNIVTQHFKITIKNNNMKLLFKNKHSLSLFYEYIFGT